VSGFYGQVGGGRERTGRKIEIFFFPASAHTGEEEE